MPNAAIDIVSWRVIAFGPRPDLVLPGAAAGDPAQAMKARRLAYLPGSDGFVEVPVYDRYALSEGAILHGPAILEEHESTVVVAGPARMQVDRWGNVIVDMPEPVARRQT
jgi:N-methylhydantoinase A